MKVCGYSAKQSKAPLAPFDFERREPRDFDVVIDIQYCGICHSDIHQVNNEWEGSNTIFPMVPGHEITGIVSNVGAKATRYKKGDRVAVGCMVNSCRKCDACTIGMEQYCTGGGPTLTYNDEEFIEGKKMTTQGGYSNKIVVDENYVLTVPQGLPLDKAAPLLCAGITLYSPLIHWNAGPHKRVAIIGLGGLGHMGVKIANALGAEVTVLSHSLKKQEDAKRLGADKFYATSDANTFKSLAGYFDLIINTVSVNLDMNKYLNMLKLDGVLVIVGIPENQVQFASLTLVGARRSIAGSNIGGIKETQEMLEFCKKNNIACDIEKISIDQVNEAYKRVLNSDVKYRFVIDIANSLHCNNNS